MAKGTCGVEGCFNASRARGLCNRHYKRWRRHGSATGGGIDFATTPRERLEARYEVRADGCWHWQRTTTPEGYGFLSLNGAPKLAHILSYQLNVGPIPEGLQLDHLCRNRACCNPAHLEAVTQTENIRRGSATHLNEAKVAEIRSALADGLAQRAICKRYGVHQSTISNIARGKTWT